jgi:MFS family permease
MMLDAGEAAMVACSVWLLLASRNFESTKYAALAGVAVGVGMLTKQTFAWFVLGVLLVMLLRGGWRQWRGLVVFALVAGVICSPWYIVQIDNLVSQASVASSESEMTTSGSQAPHRYSLENAEWYFWSGLNWQNRLPLFLLAAIGAVVAAVRLSRSRRKLPLQLEMLIGGFVGWAGITWTLSHEPRYSIPLLVYMAVLGTGWMLSLSRIPRIATLAVFGVIVLVNALGASFGFGPTTIQVAFPGAPDATRSYVQARRVTLYSNDGFVFGKPIRGGDMLPVMRALHDRGVRRIQWTRQVSLTGAFNPAGLKIFARFAGLRGTQFTEIFPTLRPNEAKLVNLPLRRGSHPCADLGDGTGVWIYRVRMDGHLADGCPTAKSS